MSRKEEERSLSARRAWIEMFGRTFLGQEYQVALRKESVDRNIQPSTVIVKMSMSLSARRAWIEMSK